MKLTTSLTILASTLSAKAMPHLPRQATNQIDSLLPSFGVVAGTDPNFQGQVGSCRGIKLNGDPVAIQCSVKPAAGQTFTEFACPPDRTAFIAKLSVAVVAGKVSAVNATGNQVDTPITFSTDSSDTSVAMLKARATAALIVIQNFSGLAGTGCPAVSAPNFQKMQVQGVFEDKVLVPAGVTGRR
jgi:hypothetical protein